MVAAATGFQHINVGTLVKENALHQGKDDEFDAFILDEDKVDAVVLARNFGEISFLTARLFAPSRKGVRLHGEHDGRGWKRGGLSYL
jgi:hypothetical protein